MGGKQPGPSRTAPLSAGKHARSSASKPLWVPRGERGRQGAPDLLETCSEWECQARGVQSHSLASTFQHHSASIPG